MQIAYTYMHFEYLGRIVNLLCLRQHFHDAWDFRCGLWQLQSVCSYS